MKIFITSGPDLGQHCLLQNMKCHGTHFVMLLAHAFSFAWNISFYFGTDEGHIGSNETKVGQTLLHNYSS